MASSRITVRHRSAAASIRRKQPDAVLLDLETNTDVDDPARPLSHAGLVMHWLQGTWPASSRAAETSAS